MAPLSRTTLSSYRTNAPEKKTATTNIVTSPPQDHKRNNGTAAPEKIAPTAEEIPSMWYQSRLERARASNTVKRAITTATDESRTKPSFDLGASRQTELSMRMRILGERDDSTWTAREMQAALNAGNLANTSHKSRDKAELRQMTHALAAAARAQAQEAAAEAKAAAVEQAEAAAAPAVSPVRAGRRVTRRPAFWALDQARPRAAAAGALREAAGDTHRTGEVSEDESSASLSLSEDETSLQDYASSSYRASFRARGAAYAARAAAGAPPQGPSKGWDHAEFLGPWLCLLAPPRTGTGVRE